MNNIKIALVTGGNKGIGLEICRQLAQRDITVILTARSHEKGFQVCESLKKERIYVEFRQLDVTAFDSFHGFAESLRTDFGRLDILINNSRILIDQELTGLTVTKEIFTKTLETNLYGPLFLCQVVIPLMKQNNFGRIVNLSSDLGALHKIGAGYPAYRVSKTALNAVTANLAAEVMEHNILINAVHPGWVRTDMGGQNAERSIEEGADTAVWLALLQDDGPTGGFFWEKKQFQW